MAFVDYPFNLDRPYINVQVKNPANNVMLNVLALVDTGADYCLFPASLAAALGIDLKDTAHTGSTRGVEDILQTTYKHNLKISLLNPKDRKTLLKELPDCLIEFSDKDLPPILGAGNFLKYFTLTIAYGSKKTRLVY